MSLIIHGLVYDQRMAGRPKASLELTETQRQELEPMARAGTSSRLAGAPSALSFALHTHQRFLDEHGRTLLPGSSHITWQLSIGCRVR
jgi:hypothetical protein